MSRVRRAKFPGGEFELGEELSEARRDAESVQKEKKPQIEPVNEVISLNEVNRRMLDLGLDPSPSGMNIKRYKDLAHIDPNLALAGLRMEMEILGRNLAKGFDVDIPESLGASRLFRLLLESGAITRNQFELIDRLVRICTAAIHGTRVQESEALDALEYAQVLADQYIEWLSWGFSD